MKTKFTFILVAAMMALGVNAVKAQVDNNGASTSTTNIKTASVDLKITLKQIQTIEINNGKEGINFSFDTKDKYAKGMFEDVAGHLKVSSTGGFIIEAKANELKATTGNKILDLQDVKIEALKNPTTNGIEITSMGEQALKNEAFQILSAKNGGFDKLIDMKYIVGKDGKYMNILNEEESLDFTTTITYSILPQ